MSQPRTYTVYELEAESGFDRRTITYYISEGLLPKVGRRGPKTTYPQEFHDRLMFIRRCRDLQDSGKLRAVTLSEIADVMRELSADDFRAAAEGGRSDDWIRDRFVEPDLDTSAHSIPAERAATDEGDDQREAVDRTAFSRPPRMASMRQRRERMQTRPEQSEAPSWSDQEVRSAHPEPAYGDSGEPDSVSPALDNDLWSQTLSLGAETGDTSAEFERLAKLSRIVQERARAGAAMTPDYSGERLIRVPITDDIMLSVRNIPERDAQLVEDLADLLRRIMRIS